MTATKHVLCSNGGWLRIGPLGIGVSVICNPAVEVCVTKTTSLFYYNPVIIQDILKRIRIFFNILMVFIYGLLV